MKVQLKAVCGFKTTSLSLLTQYYTMMTKDKFIK